jgi:hypothetical protein
MTDLMEKAAVYVDPAKKDKAMLWAGTEAYNASCLLVASVIERHGFRVGDRVRYTGPEEFDDAEGNEAEVLGFGWQPGGEHVVVRFDGQHEDHQSYAYPHELEHATAPEPAPPGSYEGPYERSHLTERSARLVRSLEERRE